jgi:hypothetical protein
MLVPAILYKAEIESAFAKELYTDGYFYYSGYAHCGSLPEINAEDLVYQYAIIDKSEKLIGYICYQVTSSGDCAYNFGLYSFDRGNCIIGKDLYEKMEELVSTYHRVEWRMVGGNPVQKHYDAFCKRHNGNRVTLHDMCKDKYGKYHNEYIYEIIND